MIHLCLCLVDGGSSNHAWLRCDVISGVANHDGICCLACIVANLVKMTALLLISWALCMVSLVCILPTAGTVTA